MPFVSASSIVASAWLNTSDTLTLEKFRGRVVLIEVFQMLCPGCVSHGLPQAQRVHNAFRREDVIVLGLHSVFEHHDAQGSEAALTAFLHEYRLTFPVAIDAPSTTRNIPQTMARYKLQGTPTTILIDRQGRLRKQKFGVVEDLVLGAEIMSLITEDDKTSIDQKTNYAAETECTADGCVIPNS